MRHVGIFVAQTAVSWLALQIVFWVTAFIDTPPYDGALSLFGWGLLGTLGGIATNLAVALIGLPLRLLGRTRHWLEQHGGVLLLAASVGAVLIGVAFATGSPVEQPNEFGEPVPGFAPNDPLYFTGWATLAFGLVHTWWPRAWRAAPRALRENPQP